jgi:hypothetical protein
LRTAAGDQEGEEEKRYGPFHGLTSAWDDDWPVTVLSVLFSLPSSMGIFTPGAHIYPLTGYYPGDIGF